MFLNTRHVPDVTPGGFSGYTVTGNEEVQVGALRWVRGTYTDLGGFTRELITCVLWARHL